MEESNVEFTFFECTRPECRFRFPFTINKEGNPLSMGTIDNCPKCGAIIDLAAHSSPHTADKIRHSPKHSQHRISVLVDNIRSTYNVGSIFRSADGCQFDHIHLCGISPTPENHRVGKTALGAENTIQWTSHNNSIDTALNLHQEGWLLWGLENTPNADSIYSIKYDNNYAPIALIIGNEIAGIDPGLLAICDRIITIPMLGYKRSLNVASAFGIAAYHLRFGLSDNNLVG
jgi:23S rRNA (guanosine2251-2'-O)-methyltransferase